MSEIVTDIDQQIALTESEIADALSAGKDTTKLTTKHASLIAQRAGALIVENRRIEAARDASKQEYLSNVHALCADLSKRRAVITGLEREIEQLMERVNQTRMQVSDLAPNARFVENKLYAEIARSSQFGLNRDDMHAIMKEYGLDK